MWRRGGSGVYRDMVDDASAWRIRFGVKKQISIMFQAVISS